MVFEKAIGMRMPFPTVGNIVAILKLMRAHSAAGAALLVLVGGQMAGARLTWAWLLPAGLAFLLAAAGNADNDICDLAVDRVNRPNRPLPAGTLTLRQAEAVRLGLVLTALLLALRLGWLEVVGAVSALGLTAWYTRALKCVPLAGHLLVGGLTAVPLLYGGLVAGNGAATLWAAGGVGFFFAGRELVKAIHDVPGDERAGCRTVPVAWGEAWAWRVSAGLFGAAVGWSWYALRAAGVWPGWAILGAVGVLAPLARLWRGPSVEREEIALFLAWSKVGGLALLALLLLEGGRY